MVECRICLEEEGDSDFINPCKCSSKVHTHCIKKWMLSKSNTNPTDCEVCLHQYSVDVKKMFAQQLLLNNIIIEEEEDEDDDEEEETEITIHYESTESSVNQIVPSYNVYISDYERRRITRRILRKLIQKDRIIKERCFAIFLLTFITDGFLIFSYFNVCRYDKECRIDVMAIGGATNLLLLMGFIYLLFLQNHNQNIRKNITSGVSI